MLKTHATVVHRRRCARRALIAAASGMVLVIGKGVRADDVWAPTNSTPALNWSTAQWWSTGVPTAGTIADIYVVSCSVDVSTGDLGGVQIANGAALNLTISGKVLQTSALEIGGTTTGAIPGSSSNTGSGSISQTNGFVEVDSGGNFAIDSASAYSLSGSGFLQSQADEQLGGKFSQSGGTNQVTGASLINSGLYTISGSTGASINCDSYINSGTFNQSAGTLQNSSGTAAAGTFNFSNTNSFTYTGGNFYGVMNNSGSVVVNATTIPFGKGIINNGLLTINGSTGTFAGIISGGTTGNINFKGGVSLTLAGNNNYAGSTLVTNGTVMLNCPVGNKTNSYGGAFQGPVTIQAGATLQNLAGNQLAGSAPLTLNGGTYNLNGFDNSVGAVNLNTGTITTTTGGVGIGLNSTPTSPGTVTTTRGAGTITGGIRCSYAVLFNVSSNAPLTVNGAIGNYNTSLGIPFTLTGGGTAYISGASKLTTIDIQNGTLMINEGGNLGGLNTLVNVETGGTLGVFNQPLTIGDLTGGYPSSIDLGTGSLTVTSSSTGSTYPGTFIGTGTLAKSGSGPLTLTGTESSTGPVTVNAGTLTMSSTSVLSSNTLTVYSGGTLNLNGTLTAQPSVTTNGTVNIAQGTSSSVNSMSLGAVSLSTAGGGGSGQINLGLATPHTSRTLLQVSSLSFGGSSGAWVGQLDLSNNDMIIHNSNFTTIQSLVKSGYGSKGSWNGTGIASSAAAVDPAHLTAIGVVSNDLGNGNALYSLASNMSFDNVYPVATDVLLKYTYYGDANLDGQVNSTDYTLIDSGFLNGSTGWYNGDFNYDNVVNGSDYTLIDNAFNMQGSNLSTSAEIAATTAQIAGASAVPEPVSGMLLVTMGAVSLLRRRRVKI